MIPLGSGDEMESKYEHAHFAKRYHGINLSPKHELSLLIFKYRKLTLEVH